MDSSRDGVPCTAYCESLTTAPPTNVLRLLLRHVDAVDHDALGATSLEILSGPAPAPASVLLAPPLFPLTPARSARKIPKKGTEKPREAGFDPAGAIGGCRMRRRRRRCESRKGVGAHRNADSAFWLYATLYGTGAGAVH
jgi:hypothetical protein